MKKYLLVIDMQKDFVDGSLGTAEAQAIVPAVAEKIRRFEGEVIFTQDTHGENYMETQEGKFLPVLHCIKGTPGHEVIPELQEFLADAKVFLKGTFGSVDLAAYLSKRAEEIESIELIGLCTDICVISNAVLIKSFFPEIELSVDASCCAGVTPQSHKNALEAMKMLQIEIKNEE